MEKLILPKEKGDIMKKFLKVLITIISILTIIIGINFMTANDKVYADVGNFKSYSSTVICTLFK